eukprot:5189177-Prymnesium_polylepis.1
MASSPRRPPRSRRNCLPSSAVPTLTLAKTPRRDSNPRPLRSGASELTTTPNPRVERPTPGKSTFYSLCLTAQCASAR